MTGAATTSVSISRLRVAITASVRRVSVACREHTPSPRAAERTYVP